MKRSKAVSILAASALTLLLTACGGTPKGPAYTAASLQGSWSLFGPLPEAGFETGAPPASGLALSIDVVGNQLIAGSSLEYMCGEFSVGGSGGVLVGTLNADGTFTLTQQVTGDPEPPLNLQITGKASSTADAGWSGTYTYTPSSPSCSQTFTGSFVATAIQPLSGTYTGTTTAQTNPLPAPPIPVTVAATLTQGATIPGTTPSTYKASAVTGSITIGGVSCFTSGTSTNVTSVPFSALLGNAIVLNFTMDDGSTLNVFGYEEDLAADKLNILFMADTSSKCEFQTVSRFELSK